MLKLKRPFSAFEEVESSYCKSSPLSPQNNAMLVSPMKKARRAPLESVCGSASPSRSPGRLHPGTFSVAADDSRGGIAICNGCLQHVKSVERVFSQEEVKKIVKKAVEEKERELREELEKVMSNRLQEQFNAFCSYNQDFLQRHARENDYSESYLS
jgi:hypothetical protein